MVSSVASEAGHGQKWSGIYGIIRVTNCAVQSEGMWKMSLHFCSRWWQLFTHQSARRQTDKVCELCIIKWQDAATELLGHSAHPCDVGELTGLRPHDHRGWFSCVGHRSGGATVAWASTGNILFCSCVAWMKKSLGSSISCEIFWSGWEWRSALSYLIWGKNHK